MSNRAIPKRPRSATQLRTRLALFLAAGEPPCEPTACVAFRAHPLASQVTLKGPLFPVLDFRFGDLFCPVPLSVTCLEHVSAASRSNRLAARPSPAQSRRHALGTSWLF